MRKEHAANTVQLAHFCSCKYTWWKNFMKSVKSFSKYILMKERETKQKKSFWGTVGRHWAAG